MKKILIVNKSFEIGGIQSSMVNMANELSKYYDVDLFVYNADGIMKERLDCKVKVLVGDWRFKALSLSVGSALKSKDLRIILFRLFFTLWSKVFSNRLPVALAIKHQTKMVGYDLAIAYHQEQRKKSVYSGFVRVVDKCVEAKKKVAWLHFDSEAIDLDSSYNNQFYKKMDKIVCVSKSLMNNFKKNNKELSGKTDYCYNFIPYEDVLSKSSCTQEIPYPTNSFVCFSACRLTKVKAIERSVYALEEVLKEHTDVVWYIAGDGPEKHSIEMAIEKCGLREQVILIGAQNNPYSYMKNADLTLNVSYHEAAPMIFFESKILGTPVFATRTSSVEELLNDDFDSFVCENNNEGIKSRFSEIMNDRNAVFNAKENLKNYSKNSDALLDKISSWLV